MMSRSMRLAMAAEAKRNAAKLPAQLTLVAESKWPADPPWLSSGSRRNRVWVSNRYIVQEYFEKGTVRISVSRAAIGNDGQFVDGITWDELQAIKRAIGFGEATMIEIFPPDADLIYVANVRHLWVLPEPPPFMWRKT